MSQQRPVISMIAAVAQNGAIGHRNRLLYRLPDDLKRFKRLTTGHTVVMGRRTFESLPGGALPNRRNIVLSTTLKSLPGAEVCGSLSEAVARCCGEEEIFVIGGAQLYREAMPVVQRLYLTHVVDTPDEADAFFPPMDEGAWRVTACEAHQPDERHAQGYNFVDYERVAD